MVAGDIYQHFATKITMAVPSANDIRDSLSDEVIVKVIEQESDTESDEDGEDIDDNNNSRKQSTCSRSGRIQGKCLTQTWFGD